MISDMQEIEKFLKENLLEFNRFYEADSIAYINDRVVFENRVTLFIYYNDKYSQYDVNIEWHIPEVTVSALGLHLGYNTNYQTFTYNDNELSIIDDCEDKVEICITVKSNDHLA